MGLLVMYLNYCFVTVFMHTFNCAQVARVLNKHHITPVDYDTGWLQVSGWCSCWCWLYVSVLVLVFHLSIIQHQHQYCHLHQTPTPTPTRNLNEITHYLKKNINMLKQTGGILILLFVLLILIGLVTDLPECVTGVLTQPLPEFSGVNRVQFTRVVRWSLCQLLCMCNGGISTSRVVKLKTNFKTKHLSKWSQIKDWKG